MKGCGSGGRWVVAGLLVLVGVLAGRPAEAYRLRAPQVAFNSSVLDSALSALDGSINVNTDQFDAQVMSFRTQPCSAGPIDLSLELEAANGSEIGFYDVRGGATPARGVMFPASARPGSAGWMYQRPDGGIVVARFDENFGYLGSTTYYGFDREQMGVYVDGPDGIWYSQDVRNASTPHVLTYLGTGINYGALFLCCEPAVFDPARPRAFANVIFKLGWPSECITPTRAPTWGSLKARYR